MKIDRSQIVMLAVSLLLCAAAAEGVIRALYGQPVHFRYPQEFYRADPDIGHWLEPGQSSFTHDEPVETNSLGIRDREFSQRIPDGTRRVLALGDSQTYGEGLRLDETWPKQLERRLAERAPNWRWEVINAGISGTDTWQHERVLERLARSYDLDVVVLGFYVNDVTRIYTPASPHELTNTTKKRVAYVLKRSALVSLLWGNLQALVLGAGAWSYEQAIIDGSPDARIREAWQQVAHSLGAMKARCDESNARFVLAVLPRRDQVQGRVSSLAFNTEVAEIARSRGIDVVDLLEPLRAAYAEHGEELFIAFDGHDSALANRVISDQLAEVLRATAR